jgi:hypothetical protein
MSELPISTTVPRSGSRVRNRKFVLDSDLSRAQNQQSECFVERHQLEGRMAGRSSQTSTIQSADALAGTVERVTFHNAENGFCVLKVQGRGKRDLSQLWGTRPSLEPVNG